MSVSSNSNRVSINFDAIAGNADVDEETWLIPPPSAEAPTQTHSLTDSATQSSGHIIEWLQGATLNMDYRTRSALGRTLASQAAKKKTRSVEKVRPIAQELGALDEAVEPAAGDFLHVQAGFHTPQRRSADSIDARGATSWPPRHANTARVAPTVVSSSAQNLKKPERLPWSSPRSDAAGQRPSSASKSHSTGPDLLDIQKIAEQQELALREQTLHLQRKSSTQSDNGRSPPVRPQTGPPTTASKVNTSMASSRSVDFFSDSGISASTHAAVTSSHISRLPTPVRRGGGGRSMIPTPASRVPVKAAIRGFASGSTPSLSIPNRRPVDAQSEGGQSDCSEQRWADECF